MEKITYWEALYFILSFFLLIYRGLGSLALTNSKVIHEGHLKTSWTDLITSRLNFLEVQWWSLFLSTFHGRWYTSYNVPPTSRKRAPCRWSLRNFSRRSSLFMVGKAQKSHGCEIFMKDVLMVFHPFTFSIRTQNSFPGVKLSGRVADHSPPSSAEVKECVEPYLHSPSKHSWCGAHLEKHRDNFTFTRR
jgi:hypothetical protein